MRDFLRNTLFRQPSHSLFYLGYGALGLGVIVLALINWRHAAFATMLVFGSMIIVTALAEWMPFNQLRLAAMLRILGIGLIILIPVVAFQALN